MATRTLPHLTATCGAALLSLGLVACGTSTATSPGVPATAPGGSAIATAPPATGGPAADEDDSGDSASATAGAKVSANTASEREIATALTAAGVTNPGRWAAAVVEYRPYPTDDPYLTALRKHLARDSPDDETTDKIVSVLTL